MESFDRRHVRPPVRRAWQLPLRGFQRVQRFGYMLLCLLAAGTAGSPQTATASPQAAGERTATIQEPTTSGDAATASSPPAAEADSATETSAATAEEQTPSPEKAAEKAETPPARPPLPKPAEIQKQISEVSQSESIVAEEKTALLATLQATFDTLTAAQREVDQRQATAEAIKKIPVKTQQVKKELEQISGKPPELAISSDTPLEELRASKTQADAALAAARQKEAALVATETERAAAKGQLPSMIATKQNKIQELQAIERPENPEISAAQAAAEATKTAAEIYLLEQEVESLLQKQRVAEAEEELLPAQIKLARQEVARQQAVVQKYAEAINARQSVQLENALQRYREELIAADVNPEKTVIDGYADEWMQIVRDHTRIIREGARVEQQNEEVQKRMQESEASIKQAAESARGVGSGLGLKLQRERSKLPPSRDLEGEIADNDAQIEWARTLQSSVQKNIDELEGDGIGLGVNEAREALRTSVEPESTSAWTVEEFDRHEIEMLQKLNDDIDTYVNDLIALREKHETLTQSVENYRSLIDQHVMWIRSDRRYNHSDLSLAWSSFQWMVHPQNLAALGRSLWSELFRRPDGFLLWLLAALAWVAGGTRLRRRLKTHRDAAVRGNQVSMRPTLQALGATVTLAALPALFFAIPGWRIYRIPNAIEYVQAVGLGLLASAALLFPIELTRQVIRPQGLGLAHFGWKESTVQPLRTAIRCTVELMVVFTFFWMLAAHSSIVAIASSLGRPLFAALMVTLSYGLWRSLHPRTGMPAEMIRRQAGGWLDRLHYVWHPALAGLPLGLGVLSMFGYRYSAEQLTVLLYETLWLGIGLFLLRGLLRRWVMLSRRRLLLQQIRERAEAAQKQAETENEEVIAIDPEAETIDITDVNAQTLRLIQAFLITLAIIGLFWTWSSVLPALDYLNEWTLLTEEIVDGSEVKEVVVLTMANLLLPIPIIVLTIIAWRNVPGLLETALLQRLPLDNATRYAVTTLSSYALLLLGIILSASQFGLKWDSIQWLVAALGVGLGFGLQEIFANFISGIILLFEQPLRVGDVVTLGDTTGVVSKIRIRATTITNWDRQELIIPNKDLITGRLINWTLSDSTNRIVLNVGVAYGSDTRTACAILEEICAGHENVAEDPPPIVTFEGFGDSTLNIVIRCFLNSMSVRLATIHELHTAIDERFKAEGIEIAFPQRDLNIRSLPNELTSALSPRDQMSIS